MSHINREREFIILLLRDNNNNQAIALLQTATDQQVTALSEIAFNLRNLPVKSAEKYNSFKTSLVLKQLSSKSRTNKEKSELIARSYRSIIKNLVLARPILKAVIS